MATRTFRSNVWIRLRDLRWGTRDNPTPGIDILQPNSTARLIAWYAMSRDPYTAQEREAIQNERLPVSDATLRSAYPACGRRARGPARPGERQAETHQRGHEGSG